MIPGVDKKTQQHGCVWVDVGFFDFFFFILKLGRPAALFFVTAWIMSLGDRNRSRPALPSWSAMDFKIESVVAIRAYCLGPLSDPSTEPGSLDSSSIDE